MGKDLEMADLEEQQKKEAAEAKKKEKELLKQQKQAEKEAKKLAKAEAKALKKAEKEAGKVDSEKADDKASKAEKKVKIKKEKVNEKVKGKSGEPKEKFKNTIPMHRRIATKLVGAFMIPVACIVVLGVDGLIYIKDIAIEGKKRCKVKDYFNGIKKETHKGASSCVSRASMCNCVHYCGMLIWAMICGSICFMRLPTTDLSRSTIAPISACGSLSM